jgi:hypothetical protein
MRRDVVIVGRSADGREIIRWLLRGALPEKLSATPLNARAAAFSYSVSFSYQTIERQK